MSVPVPVPVPSVAAAVTFSPAIITDIGQDNNHRGRS